MILGAVLLGTLLGGGESHQLWILEADANNTWAVRSQVLVSAPLRASRMAPSPDGVWATVLDASSRVLYETKVGDPRVVRGEYHAPGAIDAVRVNNPTPALVVRTPVLPDAYSITLQERHPLGSVTVIGVVRLVPLHSDPYGPVRGPGSNRPGGGE